MLTIQQDHYDHRWYVFTAPSTLLLIGGKIVVFATKLEAEIFVSKYNT